MAAAEMRARRRQCRINSSSSQPVSGVAADAEQDETRRF
jgi:hypothetical protein